MSGVLSVPFAVLEAHLVQSPWLASFTGASHAHADRLREVLDRDRALIAAEPAKVVDAAPPAPPPPSAPAPSEPGPSDLEQEPIRTRTMARLLAAQGYRARALTIYEALLREDQTDADLRAEAERLRSQPA